MGVHEHRLAAVLCALLIVTTEAFAPGTVCGNDVGHIAEHISSTHVHTERQVYARKGEKRDEFGSDGGVIRRLNDQTYNFSSPGEFMTIQAAEEAGYTRPIRIKVVWDMVDDLDFTNSPKRQCQSVGDTITLMRPAAGQPTWSGCSDKDVVDPGDAGCVDEVLLCRYRLMKLRTEWAVDYWQRALRIKPVMDNITLSTYVRNVFNFTKPSQRTYSDTDLVIIMTARPEPFTNIAAYALCLQRDQFGRCTVGQFNWVPGLLNLASQRSPDVIGDERHTAVHEIVHILGGMSVGYNGNTPFIDEHGDMRSVEDLVITEVDGYGYSKTVTKVRTPKLLAVIREQFNCPTMSGMTLEDIPMAGGYSVHWEARLAGPEVMSYGTGSGETIVSDMTFAFLEDTNQYIANYSMGGRLVESTIDTDEGGELVATDFLRDRVLVTNPNATASRSPGYIRWGRHAGCDFVQQNARHWPDEYRCESANQYGCSSDNRVASVCTLRSSLSISKTFSCGGYDPNGLGNGVCNNVNADCTTDTGCPLPSMYQYFSDSRTGGWSDAMDYAPVQLGYWNCQDSAPSTAAHLTAEASGPGTINYTRIVEQSKETKLYGGQSHCPNCRCFISSLMDISKFALNPTFPRYGLCYRANCYKADYLQIAIRSQFNNRIDWYRCPTNGGKLYIPGYTGAFHCPKAATFCSQEEISGVKYPETVLWLEWMFWSVVFAIPFSLGCTCLYDGPRRWLTRKTKRCCGVGVFVKRRQLPSSPTSGDESLYSMALTVPPRRPAFALAIISGVTFAAGAVSFGICVSYTYNVIVRTITTPFLALSLYLMIVSVLGAVSAFKRAHGVSSLLLAYFYLAILAVILLLWGVIWAFGFTDTLRLYVDKNWSVMSELFRCCYSLRDAYETQVDSVTETLKEWVLLVGIGAVCVKLLLIVALIITGWIVRPYMLISVSYYVFNNVLLFAGVIVTVVAAVLLAEDDEDSVYAQSFLAVGVYLIGTTVFGLFAVAKKRPTFVFVHAGLMATLTAFSAFATSYSLDQVSRAPTLASTVSSHTLKLLTADTLFGVSRDEMVLIVRTNLRQLGVFFAIITALLFVMSVLSINLGVVIRHKLRARELRRFKHFEHENETSPTNLLASPKFRGGVSPTAEGGDAHSEPHRKKDLRVKIDAAIRRAEAAAVDARRRRAETDDHSDDYTLTSPTTSMPEVLPSAVGSLGTTPWGSAATTPKHSRQNSVGSPGTDDEWATIPVATVDASGLVVMDAPVTPRYRVDPRLIQVQPAEAVVVDGGVTVKPKHSVFAAAVVASRGHTNVTVASPPRTGDNTDDRHARFHSDDDDDDDEQHTALPV